MSWLASRLGRLVFPPPALPIGRRRSPDPHGLVLLFAAAVLFSSWFIADYSNERSRGSTAECVVLEEFFESPGLLASFRGTPEDLQRWVDAYDQDCR